MINSQMLQDVVKSIIVHQAMIIGPLALERARNVPGLIIIDPGKMEIKVEEGSNEKLLESLVLTYQELFGKTSVEVCRDAIKEMKFSISDMDLPKILR